MVSLATRASIPCEAALQTHQAQEGTRTSAHIGGHGVHMGPFRCPHGASRKVQIGRMGMLCRPAAPALRPRWFSPVRFHNSMQGVTSVHPRGVWSEVVDWQKIRVFACLLSCGISPCHTYFRLDICVFQSKPTIMARPITPHTVLCTIDFLAYGFSQSQQGADFQAIDILSMWHKIHLRCLNCWMESRT